MAWYSILPEDLTYLETWAARIFVRHVTPVPIRLLYLSDSALPLPFATHTPI